MRDKERQKREGQRKKAGNETWRLLRSGMRNVFGVCAVCLLLWGCQLAREEPEGSRDRLCGVLVTTEAQEERYWRLHQEEQQEQESVLLSAAEMRRLQERTLVLDSGWPNTSCGTRVEGRKTEEGEFVFEDLEDASLIMALLEEEEGEPCMHSLSAGVFQDVNFSVHVADDSEHRTSEGTVSIGKHADVILNMNLVYQRPDGSIYAVLDSTAGWWNSGQNSVGSVYSRSFKEEYTQTVNGEGKSVSQEFTVHVAVAEETVSACIKEWNARDEFLGTSQLKKGQEKHLLQPDTAYAVVEELLADGTVKRTVYTWDAQRSEEGLLTHTYGYLNGDGFLEPSCLSLEKT